MGTFLFAINLHNGECFRNMGSNRNIENSGVGFICWETCAENWYCSQTNHNLFINSFETNISISSGKKVQCIQSRTRSEWPLNDIIFNNFSSLPVWFCKHSHVYKKPKINSFVEYLNKVENPKRATHFRFIG